MERPFLVWCFILLLANGHMVFAQSRLLPQTSVIIIDRYRILSETLYGKRLDSELRHFEASQIADNQRLLQELEQEEAALTALRKTLSADNFRERAAAFDRKVQRISDEQQAKNQNQLEKRRADQLRLLAAVTPIFQRLMRDTGAVLILEKHNAFIWNDAINLTDISILRIDSALGDGSDRSLTPKQ